MYLMVEFRCVKCDDKEYGIVYYEKVFSLELLSFLASSAWVQMTVLLLRLRVWWQESSQELLAAAASAQTSLPHSCSPLGSCSSGSQNLISMQVIKTFWIIVLQDGEHDTKVIAFIHLHNKVGNNNVSLARYWTFRCQLFNL